MNVLLKTILIMCAAAAFAPAVTAETVKIPVGQQGAGMQNIEIPRRGMIKDAVEANFGAPLSKSAPVGKPPISYWEYDNYLVYFEYDKVLDTVLKYREGQNTGM